MYKPIRASFVSFVLLVAGLLTLQGCGKGDISTPADGLRNTANFAITPIASPLLDGQSSGVLRLERPQPAGSNGDVAIRVVVDSACAFKAAYFTLDYDAARYTPVAVEAGPALRGLATAGTLLELYVLDRPGRISCGQCLPRWDKLAGFSGNGLVATVRFAQRPFTAPRRASTPPDSALSQAELSWESGTGILSWRYYNQGDCDQNGEVNVADLTPLGLYFHQTCSYPADENIAKACADCDQNGELNIADLTPIGNNLGKDMLNGWNIYSTSDSSQYPASPTAGNGTAVFIGYKLLVDHDPSTVAASDRLLYTFVVSAPVGGDVYWIRPVDLSYAEGIASNYAPGGTPGNQDPQITDVICTANPVSSGGTVLITVTATDPDGDPLTFFCTPAADVSAGAEDARPGARSFLFILPSVSVDESRIFDVAVSDGRGGSDTEVCEVYIAAPQPGNSPPVISGITIPNPIASGTDALLSCTATDIDGDFLSYTWALGGSGDRGYVEGNGGSLPGYHAPTVTANLDVPLAVYVDDGHGNWVSDLTQTIHVTAGGANNAPTAVLGARSGNSPIAGTAPHMIEFDGSLSFDPDGDTITYAWDFDNDGTPDSTAAVATWTYITPGTYTCKLTVSDGSLTGEMTYPGIQVNDLGTWHVTAVDYLDDVGSSCSLASIGGLPAVVYRRVTPLWTDLAYNVATDALGSAWGTAERVDLCNPQWSSLAEVDGFPAVAYYDTSGGPGVLKYCIRAPGWPAPATLDSAADAGMYCSLVVVAGLPRVAYYYNAPGVEGEPRAVSASDADGYSWGAPVTILSAPGVDLGKYTSLIDLNGLLGVAYQNSTAQVVQFARSTDASGTAFNNVAVFGQAGSACGDHCSAAMVDGHPAIAFYRYTAGPPELRNIWLIGSTDDLGAAWPASANAITDTLMDSWLSLAVIDGQPALAWQSSQDTFYYERSGRFDVWSAGTTLQVDNTPGGDIGQYCCLKEIGNKPCVAYYDATNKDIKFAICY